MSGDTLEELIRRLPEILKERPELAEKLYQVFKDRFMTTEALKTYMEQSDQRFEHLLQVMTKRFEESDKRLERVYKETNQRFEALTKETNQRFEALTKEMNQRFEALTKEMNQRFEALTKEMNQRFEALLKQMDRRFEASEKRFEALEREVLEVKAGVGTLGRRSGIALERTILSVFRRALELRGIDVEKVEKIGIRDTQGELFSPGAKVEYDLYVHNDEHFLFEIKYHVTEEDIEFFLLKARFFERMKKVSTTKAVIALDIDEYVKRICDDRGIEIITR